MLHSDTLFLLSVWHQWDLTSLRDLHGPLWCTGKAALIWKTTSYCMTFLNSRLWIVLLVPLDCVFSLLFFKIKMNKTPWKTCLIRFVLPSHLHLLSQDYLVKLPPDSGNCHGNIWIFHTKTNVCWTKNWLASKLLAFFHLLQKSPFSWMNNLRIWRTDELSLMVYFSILIINQLLLKVLVNFNRVVKWALSIIRGKCV